MGKRKFQIGDRVRVVGIPKMTFAPSVKGGFGTEKLMLERSIPLEVLTNTETLNLSRSEWTQFGLSRNFSSCAQENQRPPMTL
jgi:hypothetical protein